VLLLAAPVLWADDTAEDAAEFVSDSSYWIMRALPPTLILLGGDDEERVGRRMADAGIASQVATELLKALVDDDRPDDPRATDGFPSGHACGAWALAEAASTEEPSVRPYAYAFAAAVTWSRVEADRHTVLQALAGAALGYAIGHASGRTHHGLLNGLLVKEKKGGASTEAFCDSESVWSEARRSGRCPGGSEIRPAITLWETTW
jgi:hypothetical protein